MNTFLLIDNAMLTVGGGSAIAADVRSGWLACLYSDEVAAVSPHVIDLDAAHEAGQLDGVMALVNATPEKLHVSLIDSNMKLNDLAHHLRRFIMIRCAGHKSLTLRFADCAVLPHLAVAFTPGQWAALVSPMVRWHVHGYDGRLVALPGADGTVPVSSMPLVLNEHQLTALDDAMLPNKVLGCLRAMRHGAALAGCAADHHRWASASSRLWRDARNGNAIVLRWLTSAALDTSGAVLQQKSVAALLAHADLGAIRAGLHAAVVEQAAKLQRVGERR